MIHPRVILYGLFITVTWEGLLYGSIGDFNIRPYQLFLGIGLILALVRGAFVVGGIGVLLVLYAASGIPGLMHSVALNDSLRILLFNGIMVLITLTVRAFLQGNRGALERGLWFWTLVVGNIVNVFGLLQVVTWAAGVPISRHFAPEFYPLYRPYSVFTEPNFYGNFLASQIAILVVLMNTPAAKRRWPIIMLTAVLAILLIALNQSRGPWIATLSVCLLFIVIRYLRRWTFPLALGIISGTVAVVALMLLILASVTAPKLTDAFTQRLQDTVSPLAEGAAQDRVKDIMRSLEEFREHPWIGNGVGTWGYYVAREGREARTPPRNLVTAWLFEKGILGAVIGVALHLAIIIRTAVALRYADPQLRMYIWAPFVGWMAVLITFQFTVLEISPFYWTVLGMLLAATDQSMIERVAQRQVVPVQRLSSSVARN